MLAILKKINYYLFYVSKYSLFTLWNYIKLNNSLLEYAISNIYVSSIVNKISLALHKVKIKI